MPGYRDTKVTEGFGWVMWGARCLCVQGGCQWVEEGVSKQWGTRDGGAGE
jgi:hypothetical protein